MNYIYCEAKFCVHNNMQSEAVMRIIINCSNDLHLTLASFLNGAEKIFPHKFYFNLEGICPYGQLPILEFDGVVLAQSMAILRYLAREYGWLYFLRLF